MIYGLTVLAIFKILSKYGYYSLFLGTFLSSLFLPLGSDLLFIGMLGAKANPWICLLVATIGNWLGGLVMYSISYAGNSQRIKRLFHVSRERIEKQKHRIDKYGNLMALIVWIPILGDLSTIALGFYRIKPITTLSYMLVGRMCRFLFWVVPYLIFKTRFLNFADSW